MEMHGPCWEWRTFGTTFGAVDLAISQSTPYGTRRMETWLVSGHSCAIVTLHDGTLDVRQRVSVDLGVECWSPTFRSFFPLERVVVRGAFAAWSLPAPTLQRDAYSQDAFWKDLVVSEAALSAVEVVLQSRRARFDDCTIEVTNVCFDGCRTRTIAVRSGRDPLHVLRAVDALGLTPYAPESYVGAVRRHLEHRRAGLQLAAPSDVAARPYV
jgi:hypothetical protein